MLTATSQENDPVMGRRGQVPDTNRMATECFAKMFQAYLESSDDVRAVIDSMAQIYNDPAADPEVRESALDTLIDALFPKCHKGDLGIDLEEVKAFPADGTGVENVQAQLVNEEATFATQLSSLMEKQGMSQVELAKATGVNQSAISMMLSRTCRPQRRTVEKLAKALGVDAAVLWPAMAK
ncbi:MAG: helix-turn-helix transcriptional regulator [Phycisphaeraceae bacterium]|nr:helix-turn-helix transcriptional regulator [Phycisphaeraceae bacterium]